MGTYKALFCLRMQFFWPLMGEDIKHWVIMCGHCVAYNAWRPRISELHLSWTITILFWIMHVDLWLPGTLVCVQLLF